MIMQQSLGRPTPATHPQPIGPGERDRLAEDIRNCLVSVDAAGDPKIRERKKDLRKGFNKAADTLSQFLVHSYNTGRPISKRLTDAIGDFFSAKTQRTQRRLSDLFSIETKEEGDVNVVQMAIAQGDLSTPMLIRLITELDDHIPVLQEMRGAAVAEVQKRAERSGA